MVLAGFAAFEVWLFAIHGAIGPLLLVLRNPVVFLAVAGLTLVSLLFHEFGHASACRYGGARPGVIGFGLYLIFPSLYTDVTDVYRLSRAARLRVDLGGVYFNAIFILVLGGAYAATGNPLFLAAVFLDNFQILQQLFPLVRMDGYFILGDLAGVPDLLGLLGAIMASLLPGARGRRAGARVQGLRRGPRIMVTAWVLVAVPLLLAMSGYAAYHLPQVISTLRQAFAADVAAVRADFAAGYPVDGLVAVINVALIVIPAFGLAYLLLRIAGRGLQRLVPGRRPGRAATLAATSVLSFAAAAAVTAAVAHRGRRRPGQPGHRICEAPGLEVDGGRGRPGPGRGLGCPRGKPGCHRVLRPDHVPAAAAGRVPVRPAEAAAGHRARPARLRRGRRHAGRPRPVRPPARRLLRPAGHRQLRLGGGPGRRPHRRAGRGGRLPGSARHRARRPVLGRPAAAG